MMDWICQGNVCVLSLDKKQLVRHGREYLEIRLKPSSCIVHCAYI